MFLCLVCGGGVVYDRLSYNPGWPLTRGNPPTSARPATVRVDRISAFLAVELGAYFRTDIPAGFPGELSLRRRLLFYRYLNLETTQSPWAFSRFTCSV